MKPLPSPPEGWRQRAGRTVPFPPGEGGQEWEVIIDGDATFQLNCATGEVYLRRGDAWYTPPWWDLPPVVRRRVWAALA